MSSLRIRTLILAVTVSAALISCGSGDEGDLLATGEGFTVTLDDFREEFENLTPEGQVMVLQPGGRMNLVTLLVNRQILLEEARLSPPVDLDVWLELSETAWLASQWLESRLDSIAMEGIDSTTVDSLLSVGLELSAVLMRDSSQAALLLEQWERDGPFQPESGMALAPWTLNGSSFIQLEGNLFSFLAGDPSFAALTMPIAGTGYRQIPVFGVWAVCRLDTMPVEPVELQPESAGRLYVSALLGSEEPVTVNSTAVEELAAHLVVSEGLYRVSDGASLDGNAVIASFAGGEITVAEVVDIFRLVRPESFFGDIPEDILVMAPPMPTIEPEIDLWMFTGNLARACSRAERARESGMSYPQDQVELTTTEHVLRTAALLPSSSVDSTEAIEFYEANSGYYQLPELRSVLLAYMPTEWMTGDQVESFEDLDQYYSSTDSLGTMLPTPPRAMEAFGPVGTAIFSAPESVFTGPVEVEATDLVAWFEVVEIIPGGSAGPENMLPVLLRDCRLSMIAEHLDEFLLELSSRYVVEIDSSAVARIDPWATVY